MSECEHLSWTCKQSLPPDGPGIHRCADCDFVWTTDSLHQKQDRERGEWCTTCRFGMVAIETSKMKLRDLRDEPSAKATDKQVGGNHYSRNAIQPIDYIVQNELDWYSGNVVKYITRFKHKGGKQDLEKVIHYAQLAMEHYYPESEK